MSDSAQADRQLIEFKGVSKSFGTRAILKDITFSIAPGTAFVLLGRSGSGKSVTLKMICGLLKADSGSVLVDGVDITKLESRQLASTREHIGFLFQSAALFDSISVGENVAFPLRRHTQKTDAAIREQVQSILEKVGLGAQYDQLPSELSGGMRKRAGLARALAMEPSILLIDEPSAGLDPITSAEIDQLLIDIKTKNHATLVVVTHNIPSARRIADRMAFLEDGHLVAQGTVTELESNENQMVKDFLKSEQTG